MILKAICHDCKLRIETRSECINPAINSYVEVYYCPKCKAEFSNEDFCGDCTDWSDSGNCFNCKMD